MNKETAREWLRALYVRFGKFLGQHTDDSVIVLQFYPEGGSYGVGAVSMWDIYKALTNIGTAIEQTSTAKIPEGLRIDLMTWYTAMYNPVERRGNE